MKKIITIGVIGLSVAMANAATKVCSKPVIDLNTNQGLIELQLNRDKAPLTVDNFVKYVNKGFYNNKVFHRVIPGFMIQGGGFDAKLKEAQTDAPIKNEANNGLSNDKYTIAMARTQDPNSATAQFFINVNNNKFLNYTADTAAGAGYAVFGKVVKGQAVVDKIAGVTTKTVGYYENVPETPVVITTAKVVSCSK